MMTSRCLGRLTELPAAGLGGLTEFRPCATMTGCEDADCISVLPPDLPNFQRISPTWKCIAFNCSIKACTIDAVMIGPSGLISQISGNSVAFLG